MSSGNFANCLAITLKFEGGFVNSIHDPGGATQQGVTIATFRRYHPGASVDDLKRISRADLETIYSDGYWRPISGDNLPAGVDLAAFDYGVNSGPGAALKALAATTGLSPVERVKAICARRLSILHGLKTWAYFGKGWGSRVNEVEATGIKWASASPQDAKDNLTQAAKEAQAKASRATNSAIGTTAATPIAVKVAEVPAWEIALGVGLVAGVVILLIFIASRHQSRAAVLASHA